MTEVQQQEQKVADLAVVIAELEKVVQEKPNNVMARHHLGLVYRKAGRVDEAIKQLEKELKGNALLSYRKAMQQWSIFCSDFELTAFLARRRELLAHLQQ